MLARTLIRAVSIGVLVWGASAAAWAQKKVIRLEAIKVEGRIQKPQAFYILQRSNLNFEGLELKENFIPKIIDFLGYVPYTPTQSFPDWLKMFRAATGLSQQALAQALAMDESTINGWERERHGPTNQSLRRIRSFFCRE